jgi:hypothetical protein
MEKKLDRGCIVLDVDFFTVFIARKFRDLRSLYSYPLGSQKSRVSEMYTSAVVVVPSIAEKLVPSNDKIYSDHTVFWYGGFPIVIAQK